MSRERKLTKEAAIEKSMFAFWKYGFRLSVRSLQRETGINRFMLQTELGGKEGVFLRALDNYLEESHISVYTPIASGNLLTIVQNFQELFDEEKNKMVYHGCFAVNTIIDANIKSVQINKRTRLFLDMIHTSFASALQNEKDNDQLDQDFDTDSAANFLIISLFGIISLNKFKKNKNLTQSGWKKLVRQIMSWRKS